nr:angiopoietin-4-like [Procambarus clarkii]
MKRQVCAWVWLVVVAAALHVTSADDDDDDDGPLTSQAVSPTSSSARAADCADHLVYGANSSGVYEIYPFTCTCGSSVRVWCDMETDGGGWTVFLARQNQSQHENFNRTWEDYKTGFGNPEGEHWLGNEALHLLTFRREYSVRLDMEYTTGAKHHYTRTNMKVDSETNKYAMTYSSTGTGTVSSNCMSTYVSRPFTSSDRDNDAVYGNCANTKGGGWWYYNCLFNNPTTPYKEGSLHYTCYPNSVVKVTKLQMKIRPVICDSATKTVFLNSGHCNACQ